MAKNALYYGDNLHVLRRYIANESIDLVYLDPPFNSNADYNVLFEERDGTRAAAQIKAFSDTWEWDTAASQAFAETVEEGGLTAQAMLAFRTFLGESDMLAYLAMMAPRLKELHRVLKDTGSLYLHCDPTASHYLKMLLDAVFGKENFRNEIVWWYRKWGHSRRHFMRNHDVILFYAKSDQQIFNVLRVPLSPETLKRFKGQRQDFADETRTRKVLTEDESLGAFRPDVWTHNALPARAAEKLHYPTQKPRALLETIIEASTRPGDVVLDPFCGCGTTVDAAQHLGRRWIGIDITALAISLIKHRLQGYGPGIDSTYEVIGEPVSLADARKLASEDPFQFQFWALGLIGARPVDVKRGADRGIDGRMFFHEYIGSQPQTRQVIVSVKGGANVGVSIIRDLVGVVTREKADVGILVTLAPATQPMRREAASAGTFRSLMGQHYQKVQIYTIEELLAGSKLDLPTVNQRVDATLRAAPKRQQSEDHPRLL